MKRLTITLLTLLMSMGAWSWVDLAFECGKNESQFIGFGKFQEDSVSSVKTFKSLPYKDIENFSIFKGLFYAKGNTFGITFVGTKEYKIKNKIDVNTPVELYENLNRTSLELTTYAGKILPCKEISVDVFNALIISYERLKEYKIRNTLEKRKI